MTPGSAVVTPVCSPSNCLCHFSKTRALQEDSVSSLLVQMASGEGVEPSLTRELPMSFCREDV